MVKPNFFILGAAKAGTTTLYDILKQHPQIFLPYEKEPMFFSRDDYYKKGLNWYVKSYFKGSEKYFARGEATPHYLYWAEKVSKRVYNVYRDGAVKFIVVLRNPTQRAYSWYWNMVADGKENLSFLDALKNEDDRMQVHWETLKYYGSMQYGYSRGGCYVEQIQQFLRFFPSANFLFLLLEDLIQNQMDVSKKVFEFLEIDSDVTLPQMKSNPAWMPRNRKFHRLLKSSFVWSELLKSYTPAFYRFKLKMFLLESSKAGNQYPDISMEAREYLREKFASQIIPLAKMTGRDLSSWMT